VATNEKRPQSTVGGGARSREKKNGGGRRRERIKKVELARNKARRLAFCIGERERVSVTTIIAKKRGKWGHSDEWGTLGRGPGRKGKRQEVKPMLGLEAKQDTVCYGGREGKKKRVKSYSPGSGITAVFESMHAKGEIQDDDLKTKRFRIRKQKGNPSPKRTARRGFPS